MLVKILLTAFLLSLNLYVYLHLLLKIRFRLLPVLLILLLTLAIWVANYKYIFIPNSDMLLLIVFSYIQIIAWYFYRFIFLRKFALAGFGKDRILNNNILLFRKGIIVIFSFALPLVLSINQLAIIWNLNLS